MATRDVERGAVAAATRSTMRGGMNRSSSAATTSSGQRTRVASTGTPVTDMSRPARPLSGIIEVEYRVLLARRHAIQDEVAQILAPRMNDPRHEGSPESI